MKGNEHFDILTLLLKMQNNYSGNLMRNSYGFQSNSPLLRGPNPKSFPMPQPLPPHPEHISTTLRQMETKIQGVEGVMKKKYALEPQPPAMNIVKIELAETRFNRQQPNQQQASNEQLLRASQNFLKKNEYVNLRNTTHFNVMKTITTHSQVRRSPQEDHPRHMHLNKTFTQEYTPPFLKVGEKNKEGHHSFVSPSRTPPKGLFEKAEEKGRDGRTPTKYKTTTSAVTKTSGMSGMGQAPQKEEKKLFKTLNEIIELKNKEKHQKSNFENMKNLKKSKSVNGFELGTVLGKGKFGEVFLSRHHESGFVSAIKKIEKKKVVEFKMLDQFTQQIRLHASLDHPNIVKFYGFFEQKEYIYLSMQYMNGGTLFDYLNESTYLPIKTAVQYLRDIIEALAYMHDKSIAHRDIKPQNIVISSEGVAKLCDFGWSAVVETSRKTYCGTFDYAPPQILERKNYDTSVDIWCIGILTFELLTGRVPFEGDKRNIVMQKILNVDKTKIDYPVDIVPEAKEFIETLVQKDPALRPKCQDLLKFKLFTTYLPKPAKGKKLP